MLPACNGSEFMYSYLNIVNNNAIKAVPLNNNIVVQGPPFTSSQFPQQFTY